MIHGTLESAIGCKQFLRDIILALSKVTMPGVWWGWVQENIACMGTYPCILQLRKVTSRQTRNTRFRK